MNRQYPSATHITSVHTMAVELATEVWFSDSNHAVKCRACALALGLATAFSGLAFTGYGVRSVVVGLLLSVCSTLLGHSIFSWCLKFLSPTFVSASKLCEPVVAALFAVFLFGEIPGILQIAGGLVILGGVLYYSRLESH